MIELRKRFLGLIEGFSDALFVFDAEGLTIHQARSSEAFLGLESDERVGKNLFIDSLCHPDDIEAERAFFESTLRQSGVSISGRFRLRHADGSDRDVEASGRNLLSDPELLGVYVCYRDVTGRAGGETARSRLAAIVESSDDAIISEDLDGIITSWNVGADRLFGYTEAEVLGRSIALLIPGDREDVEAAILEKIRRGGRIETFNAVRVNKTGGQVEVSLTISPVRDASGQIIGASKIARDLGERNRLDRELRAAEEAARAKDRFLALLSHELRTPITPVLATLSYVEDLPDLPEILREEIASIRRNIELEARLIDDLLDATRLGCGKLTLYPECLDAHASIRDALNVCQDDIDAKGLEISMALRARSHNVMADPARMQQTFWNLIKNAIKFTPDEGRIAIRSSNDGEGQLVVEVIDSGIGIKTDSLPKIFNAFEQEDRADSKRHGGLGLGLAIARMLVELHGGELTAASEGPGQGATFTVTLPTTAAREPAMPARIIASPEKRHLKLLLVEDNPDTLRSVSRLLRLHGLDVDVASNVREAIEAANTKRYDLLISDIGLPDGSGLDVIRHVRACHGLRGISLSGYGTEEDIRESLSAGFEHHMIKPVKIGPLVDLIHRTA